MSLINMNSAKNSEITPITTINNTCMRSPINLEKSILNVMIDQKSLAAERNNMRITTIGISVETMSQINMIYHPFYSLF
jgi:hypothetical protein